MSGVNYWRCVVESFNKQWIPVDDDEPSLQWLDTHHSNESRWKPTEILLGDGCILVLAAD